MHFRLDIFMRANIMYLNWIRLLLGSSLIWVHIICKNINKWKELMKGADDKSRNWRARNSYNFQQAVQSAFNWVFTDDSLSNSYTMGCLPVRGDNPRALASELSYVQVDKHGITILYHLHLCRPCKWRDIRT